MADPGRQVPMAPVAPRAADAAPKATAAQVAPTAPAAILAAPAALGAIGFSLVGPGQNNDVLATPGLAQQQQQSFSTKQQWHLTSASIPHFALFPKEVAN
ncbi:hypothetical protein ACA910_014722 [Epithemia clementina (nom. ined.)]